MLKSSQIKKCKKAAITQRAISHVLNPVLSNMSELPHSKGCKPLLQISESHFAILVVKDIRPQAVVPLLTYRPPACVTLLK